MPSDPLTVQNTSARIRSVDILRGAVMVLMAIDHVRVYSGLPAGGTEPGIFFTRWITHFCAPAFVFFAGTSAYLYGLKINNTARLARFLLTRGLLLVILELTFIRFCWTFNLDFKNFTLAGVIWMLGWCMVLMAALVWLRPAVVGIIGLAIIFLQQLFRLPVEFLPPKLDAVWEFVYTSGTQPWPGMTILYVLVPWIGVMAAGYGFGTIVTMEPARRRKICLSIGLGAIAIFLIVGIVQVMNADPRPEGWLFVFSLLGQQKYPASQMFLLMTLGPVIALVPFAEKTKGWLANVMEIFGKVPMFYYLLHIPLIHVSAVLVNEILGVKGYGDWYATAPYSWMPEEYRWSLGLLYVVFLVDVVILYFLCKWYVGRKVRYL